MNRLVGAWFLVFSTLVMSAPAIAQDPSEVPEGFVLMDDMLLPISALASDGAFTATVWPGGIVPYTFNANVNATQQAQALKAMQDIAGVAFVSFIPRTNHADWIEFQADTVNQSPVGKIGGMQTVKITSWGTKYVIVHELMHALGYIHEHQRPDRDNFVAINLNNVPGNLQHNFTLINANQVTYTSGYDFLSIMHYGPTAFSSNGQNTINCLPGYSQFQGQIGQRTYMTAADGYAIQARYLAPIFPDINFISPTTVQTSSPGFTLNVYGARFFEGSPNGYGVQGTKITWNGTIIPTTFVSPTQVQAQIPPSLISQPQTVTISVINPAPGGGAALFTQQLTVNCGSSTTVLTPGVATTTTNGCQAFSIGPPSYSQFNVCAVSSTTDWDITMGGASAAAGGNTCDFVVGSGFFGNGTVTPNVGNITHYSGNTPATLQYVRSTPLNNGQPTIFSMPAGSIVTALHISANAVSTRTLQVAGPPGLRWKLLWQGNTFGWRSSTGSYVVAQGDVGGPPVAGIGIVSTNYVLVVYSNGGPVASTVDMTALMGFDFTPVQLFSSNSITQVFQGPYSFQPFNVNAMANRWNVVGVSSPSDWDIQIGPAVSQYGSNQCDYVLANGHAGSITPTVGATSPYAFPGSTGELQFAPTATFSAFPGSTNSYTYMLLAFEFQVTAPGNFELHVQAPSGYEWDLHAPGSTSAWRSRSGAMLHGQTVSGAPILVPLTQPGWYCIVVRHNGGSTTLANVSAWATQSTIQPPILSSISPASAPANSPSFTMSVYGTDFDASSVVLWNGSPLTTTFVSSTELSADVDSSLLTSAGSASVSVTTPGYGSSATLPFGIGNPVPSIAVMTPSLLVVGDPTTQISVTGSDFVPGAVVRWNAVDVPTTYVSSTDLVADIDASLFLYAGAAAVTVFNPAPDGGESAVAYILLASPGIAWTTPSQIPAMAPSAGPVTIGLYGSYFRPFTQVFANGVPVPVTYIDENNIDVTVDPAQITQLTKTGAVAFFAQHGEAAVSNGYPLVIDGGSNMGMIRTHPLAPAPGAMFVSWAEFPVGNSPLTMIIDTGTPTPVGGFPDPGTNWVIGVTEVAGSSSWFPLFDGIGMFGTPDGAQSDGGGVFQSPQIQMPNPPLGITVNVQVIYLDANQPLGVNVTWAWDQVTL